MHVPAKIRTFNSTLCIHSGRSNRLSHHCDLFPVRNLDRIHLLHPLLCNCNIIVSIVVDNELMPSLMSASVCQFTIECSYLGGSFANMLGMHLARLRKNPDIKFTGMGENKQVLLASSEVCYLVLVNQYYS